MDLLKKTFTFEGLEKISVEFIENFMKKAGFIPLRWAVVKIEDNTFTVDSVVVKE